LKSDLFGFLFAMWVLILAGGGIIVTLLGPISISGFGELDWFIASVIKAIVAIVLVVVWILILSKLKNVIFRKEIKS
jgi:amino acid permease